jgi:hypothetical protein
MTRLLLDLLLDIEKAVGSGDPLVIRAMLMAAEDCVLEVERELMQALEDEEGLRSAGDRLRHESEHLRQDCEMLRHEAADLRHENESLLHEAQTLRHPLEDLRRAA